MADSSSNGNETVKAAGESEEDDEPIVGPGPGPAPRTRAKRPLQFEQAYLDALPSAHMYEKSYMHRDVVTHVAVSAADFFITGSIDGTIDFYLLSCELSHSRVTPDCCQSLLSALGKLNSLFLHVLTIAITALLLAFQAT